MRTMVWKDVTAAVWEGLQANVKDDIGLVLTGNVGKGSKDGIDFTYTYDPELQMLEIVEVHRAFYDPSEDEIVTKIEAAINPIVAH